MKKDVIDLGSSNVFTLFRKYFIPTLLGMLSISAVTAIDGILVGHGVGSDGIAAVNICIPVLMVFTGIGLMSGVGASVIASIKLSKGKQKSARLNITQSLIFVTVIGIIPSILMMAFPSATAQFLGASEHLTPMVREYLLWFVPCLLFEMWCSVCLFIIRLDGAPKLAMMCNVIAAIITVILGWLFIFPFGWGLMGAAFASTIGILIASVISLTYLWKFANILKLFPIKRSLLDLRSFFINIGYQCRIGSSALMTEITLAMFMFVGNHIFAVYLGDDGIGAFGIACYYLPFVFMVGNAIAQSTQPIISYNFGLGNYKRVIDSERIALFTSVFCGIIATLAFSLFPHILVGLFVNSDNIAARLAIEGFPYFSLAFVFFIINLAVIGYYQSVEQVKPATLIALLRGFVFLVPSFILLPQVVGTNGAWLALCLSEALSTLAIVILFIANRKKLPIK